MDVKERWDDMSEVMRTSGDRKQSQIWTALPVKVIEDSDGFTVKLQPTIKGRRTEPSGKAKDEDMPDLARRAGAVFSAAVGSPSPIQ